VKKEGRFEDLGQKDYKECWDYQEKIFQDLLHNKLLNRELPEAEHRKKVNTLLFVEHPHVFTLGKSGSDGNLLVNHIQLKAKDASFYHIDRGGDITYHGPGQIVAYPIFDLEDFGLTLKGYIHKLEDAIILTLKEYGIEGSRLEGATGVWLDPEIAGRARKICAIGVKASRFVTMHGLAFNVNTDLEYFKLINPCGFTDKKITSLEAESGEKQNYNKVKGLVKRKLEEVFDIELK